MGDGVAEAAIKGLILKYERQIYELEEKPRVTLVDRNNIAKLTLRKMGVEEALSIMQSYSEATRNEPTSRFR